MEYILLIILGYLFGNLNPAHIISRTKKVDIRAVGSKNPGASNITMTFGWKFGILTAFIDMAKGFVPVLIFSLLNYTDVQLLIVGTAAIIGHIYPVLFKFKGGKGTATFIGVMLALNPLFGFILGCTIVILTILTDYIAIGTIAMMILWGVLAFLNYEINFFLIALIIPFISVYKHIPNVIKIIKKQESGLRNTFKK